MSRSVILQCFVLVALLGRELKTKTSSNVRGVDRKSRKRMWQRAIIEIRKSTAGDGRHVINSKRSWENKHSTVLQGGKGRQGGVTGRASPLSSPDLPAWGGDRVTVSRKHGMEQSNMKDQPSPWKAKKESCNLSLNREEGEPSPSMREKNCLLTHPGFPVGCHCLAPGKTVGRRSPPMFQLHECLGSISATNCYSELSPERWCLQELDSPLENIYGGHNSCH